MLFKVLFSILAVYSPYDYHNSELASQFVPTPDGPQTWEEDARVRHALHGKHFGGDMILPKNYNQSDHPLRDLSFRWPRGQVFYVIDRSVAHQTQLIQKAMEQYQRFTCIKFFPRTNQRNYIVITRREGCWSEIGCIGGRQELSLDWDCYFVGLIVHEFGHGVGFMHEHQRSDRDNYIWVYKNNADPRRLDNFDKVDESRELHLTNYDYTSIMHYGNYAFSKSPGRLMTMEAKNGQPLIEPYQRPGFDKTDIFMINKYYECRS